MEILITLKFPSLSKACDALRQIDHLGEVVMADDVSVAPKKPRAKKTESPAQAPVTETGKVITTTDVQAALEKLFAATGMNVCLDVLSRYGVKFGRDLKPEQYADFIAHAEKVAAGGWV